MSFLIFLGLKGLNASTKLIIPVGIYLLTVNNRNARTRYEICSQLTIKTSERYFIPCSIVSIINFEHVIADWDES